jgi:hypothetical protein
MNATSFLGARRVPVLVNRAVELETIQRAIYHPDASCHILFVQGGGGMGKSRLSEEILWRGGNWRIRQGEERGPIPVSRPEWDWTRMGGAVVGDLIDMSAPRLHARMPFLRAIRDALIWPGSNINFTRYDTAFNEFQNQRFYMGDFKNIHQAEEEVVSQFLDDYQGNAQASRIVLILDTVEKFHALSGTELLLKEGLLTPKDMEFYTYQWLLEQIRQGGLLNTTLILVGRAEEGNQFFEAVSQAASNQADCELIPLDEITSFSLEDTETYFQSLVETDHAGGEAAAAIKNIAEDRERLETLWLYTGGQPVRLALYTDLIVEDRTIPERLQESPQQAKKSRASADELKKAQKEIEAGFIRLLFGYPSMRTEILKALVRTPRGLDVEQLHYCLGSKPNEAPQEWLARSANDPAQGERSGQIAAELNALRNLAIAKIRPGERLGLQDEVYRIYTNALAEEERGRALEQEARQKLYAKLQAWAQHQFAENLKKLTERQANAERQLRFERPSLVLDVRFPTLPKREQNELSELRATIQQWELEDLHYSLLVDFTNHFNNELFELADQKWTANDENADAVIRAELWQLLKDPAYALKEFGKLTAWESLKQRGEEILQAFKRFALQNDASDWIKRFGLRKDYERAVEFAGQLEDTIQRWGKEKTGDSDFRIVSWQNTLARSERALWRDYARLHSGEDVLATLADMEKNVQDLEKLLQYSQNEMAFPERGEGETGFIGHPAEIKTRRLTAMCYNYIGYGYANQGNSSKARDAYGKALLHMRNMKNPAPVREATTRNNLARVLADRGHARGRRLCLDALELRKEQGAEVPIAYSYSTLALIDNDHGRPDLAWVEAAIAVAYFDKAEDPRGLGLALLQLSEALRRMARLARRRSEAFYLRGDLPEVVLETAERAVNKAVDMFPESGEKIRRVEAWIERGCLERDLILVNQSDENLRQRHYRDALYYLNQAVQLANGIKNSRLELDARVNIAWTHYRFRDFDRAEETLKEAETLLPGDCRFKAGKSLPSADRDDLHLYQQLSKMYGLRGRMALDQFHSQTEGLKEVERDPKKRRGLVRRDKKVQKYLQQAAEAYVLALAYAQLLSPRSSALTIIYDACYDHIKGFNLDELNSFQEFAHKARRKFGVSKIKLADLGSLNEFLAHTFGVPSKGP